MTKKEFISKQQAAQREINRYATVWTVLFFGGLIAFIPAFDLMDKRQPTLWAQILFGLLFAGFLIGDLIVLGWLCARPPKKHGVVCPLCNNSLMGHKSRRVLITGKCFDCGHEIISDSTGGGETTPLPQSSSSPLGIPNGYGMGCLLPTITVVVGVFLCAYAVRVFCIRGTAFDQSEESSSDNDLYYNANRAYNNGKLDLAGRLTAQILAKTPNHGPANVLMARIELTRTNRASAIMYLRRAQEGSPNREEIAKWIESLESGK